MKHRLSFASFTILSDNILEVVVDDGIEMTLEMTEEYHHFTVEHMSGEFGLLVNRVNDYSYTYEAELLVASNENMKAIAFVYYDEKGKKATEQLNRNRAIDEWNFQMFSGLELGWQKAVDWLEAELISESIK